MIIFGLCSAVKRGDLIIVDIQRIGPDPVLHGIEPFARLVGARTMGQVSACIEAHPQNGVSGLQKGKEHTLVRLAAGIGLHIDKAASEQFLCPFDRKFLGHVHKLAPAIIAAAGIAFGIFVRHD